MEFRIDDIPLQNPRVADAVVRCLQQCDRALNAVLVETEALMPADDWKLLRRGVGRIAGGDMMASFEFEPGSAKIICERPYFDRRAVMTALGLG